MPGRAAAGQRYRRGAHRALLLAAAWLLLTTGAAAQAPPACAAAGRAADDDGRAVPDVRRAHGTLACMPADTALGREVHERFTALAPSHAFEAVGALPADGAAADLYEALHAVSSLRGIPYFSIRRRSEQELFRTAHAIDGRGAAIADPVPSADGRSTAYALVDDASFGRAPYRLEYRIDDDDILLVVSNPLPLRVMGIRLIDAEGLLIALLIAPGSGAAGAERAVHGLVAARAPEGSLLESFLESSLRNRLAAMQGWIAARAAAAARAAGGTGSETRAGGADAAQG